MTDVARVGRALRIFAREQRRNYVLMALLTVLPAYLLVVVDRTVSTEATPVWVSTDGLVVAYMVPRVTLFSVLMAAVASGVVGGVAGVFVMQRAKDSDVRLVQSGYSVREVLLSRFLLLGGMLTVVSIVSLTVLFQFFTPANPLWFVFGVALVAGMYALVGMLVGTILDSLPSLYVILFGTMVDLRVLQNPEVTRGNPEVWMRLFPGSFPIDLLFEAAFTESVPVATALWALVYFAVLAVLTLAVTRREIGSNR